MFGKSGGRGRAKGDVLGAIEIPLTGWTMPDGPFMASGWALDPAAPLQAVLLEFGGRRTELARVGIVRTDVAEKHPAVAHARTCGWRATFDARGLPEGEGDLRLIAVTADGRALTLAAVRVRKGAAGERGARPRAAFTIVQNEPVYLPIWIGYYARFFDAADLYVLDHDSTDGSAAAQAGRARIVPIHRSRSFDHSWMKQTVEAFQSFLLQSYETVVFAEVDEFLVADPARYRDLGEYLERFEGIAARATGYNVVHHEGEAPLDFARPILAQRRHWHPAPMYNKRLIARAPLHWSIGFHDEFNAPEATPDPALFLAHLHRVDFGYCLARHEASARRKWSEYDVQAMHGNQNRLVDPAQFRQWFYAGDDLAGCPREDIPERIRPVF